MKNTNRQTLPLGRSTKAEKAGLSLLRPKLFTVVGDTYKYFNAIFQKNISKPISKIISPFIARLSSKKFRLDPCECYFALGYLHPRAKEAIRFHFDQVGWTRRFY